MKSNKSNRYSKGNILSILVFFLRGDDRKLVWPLYLGERQRPCFKLHSVRVPRWESNAAHSTRFWGNWQVPWASFFPSWNTNYFPFILFIDLSSCRWRRVLVIWVTSKDKNTSLTFMDTQLGWGPVLWSGFLARDHIDMHYLLISYFPSSLDYLCVHIILY
jgi:hypothetical protein